MFEDSHTWKRWACEWRLVFEFQHRQLVKIWGSQPGVVSETETTQGSVMETQESVDECGFAAVAAAVVGCAGAAVVVKGPGAVAVAAASSTAAEDLAADCGATYDSEWLCLWPQMLADCRDNGVVAGGDDDGGADGGADVAKRVGVEDEAVSALASEATALAVTVAGDVAAAAGVGDPLSCDVSGCCQDLESGRDYGSVTEKHRMSEIGTYA